jgi:hypothetical protein
MKNNLDTKSHADVRTLCHACYQEYRDSFPDKDVKRLNKNQKVKELCMFCQKRMGFDYIITPKNQNPRRRTK